MLIGSAHVGDVPLHAPDHPVKIEFASGVAVSVTVWAGVVFATWVLHVGSVPVVQLRPVPLMVPLPLPIGYVVSVYLAGAKLAYTHRSPGIETVHVVAVPLHEPDQPVKIEFASGVAVSVTVWAGVVFATLMLHVGSVPVVQLRSPPMIVPLPLPIGDAVSVYLAGWKVA